MLRPTIREEELLDLARQREAACGRERNDDSLHQAVARAVLERWFGQEWLETKLKSDPYFQPVPLNLPTDKFQPQYRVTRLAELLLHLQGVEGVESQFLRLRDGTLSEEVAALEGAALLLRAGHRFSFVEPMGKRGNDYDVKARILGIEVCCEMKAKDDSISPSVNTLRNTLDQARTQVPNDTRNFLFVESANPWMLTKEGYDATRGAIMGFFRSSRRYAFIILHADEWRTLRLEDDGSSGTCVVRRWVVYENGNARVKLPFGLDVLVTILTPRDGRWRGIDEVVCSAKRAQLVGRVRSGRGDASASVCF